MLKRLAQAGRFSDAECRGFFTQLLEGLCFCHSLAVFHRGHVTHTLERLT